jgi:hypothetical protein
MVPWVSPEHRIQNQTDYAAVSNKWRIFTAVKLRIFRSNVKEKGEKTEHL